MIDFSAEKYSSEWDCTYKIVKSEGTLALWEGVGANIIRSIVARIVLQCCCDLSHLLVDCSCAYFSSGVVDSQKKKKQ